MPMRNSTLLYFVNFNSESDFFRFTNEDDLTEEILTAMEIPPGIPSEGTIRTILNFARSYEVLESEKTGCVELNLN